MQRRRRRAGEVNLTDLLLMILALVCSMTGVAWGIKFGSALGIWGAILGSGLGLMAGVAGAVLTVLAIAVASEPFDAFWRRWRPYPPTCENGTCTHRQDYCRTEIPEDVVARVRGLSRFGHRCRCGNVYGGGCDYPLLNRWIRVLPNGQVRPYLRHRILGRWIPDKTAVVVKAAEYSKPTSPPIEVPGWVLPVALAVISGGIATWVAYVSPDAKPHPIRPWFVITCTVVGLGCGCVVWVSGLKAR